MAQSFKSVYAAFSERLFDQNKFAIKLGLDNISAALDSESLSPLPYRSVIVGGTNGKGETSACLSQILTRHDLRVGLFTSPHLVEVRERFRIDGEAASQDDVVEVGQYVLNKYGEDGEPSSLTFFEMTTLMAALLFRRADVDIAIFEVGLGGRLDSVNALSRELVVVTNIGLDHQSYLGETIEEIASEKLALLKSTTSMGIVAPQSYRFENPFSARCEFAEDRGNASANNQETAQLAAKALIGELIPDRVTEATRTLRWPGRFDRRQIEVDDVLRTVVFDAAHNPDGVDAFVKFVQETGETPESIFFGAMRDKSVSKMLEKLSVLGCVIYGVQIDSQRALTADELSKFSEVAETFGSFEEATSRFTAHNAVVGSVFLIGEAFAFFGLSASSIVKK